MAHPPSACHPPSRRCFLGPLATWRQVDETSYATSADGNGTLSSVSGNAALVHTDGGRLRTKCLDPRSEADTRTFELIGSLLCSISTLVFIANVVIGWRIALATMRRYTLQSLLSLPDDEDEDEEGDEQDFEPEPIHITRKLTPPQLRPQEV